MFIYEFVVIRLDSFDRRFISNIAARKPAEDRQIRGNLSWIPRFLELNEALAIEALHATAPATATVSPFILQFLAFLLQ